MTTWRRFGCAGSAGVGAGRLRRGRGWRQQSRRRCGRGRRPERARRLGDAHAGQLRGRGSELPECRQQDQCRAGCQCERHARHRGDQQQPVRVQRQRGRAWCAGRPRWQWVRRCDRPGRHEPEPAGVHCPNGGSKVSVGSDANGNSMLDAVEVSSEAYVSHGENGSNGLNGANGTDGANGADERALTERNGANGAAGRRTVQTAAAAWSRSWPRRRDLVHTAAARSARAWIPIADGILAGCRGDNQLHLQRPTGSRAQLGPCDGTERHSASQHRLHRQQRRRPSRRHAACIAADGAVVRVSGAGAADWRIAQNFGRVHLHPVPDELAGLGGTRERSKLVLVASSADGSKLVSSRLRRPALHLHRFRRDLDAAPDRSRLVVRGLVSRRQQAGGGWRTAARSTPPPTAGVTWTARDVRSRLGSRWPPSADGSKLVAAAVRRPDLHLQRFGASPGQRASPIEIGGPWPLQPTAASWWRSHYGGQIYTSTDSGVTWTARESDRDWWSVASSADGSKLVAAVSTAASSTPPPIQGVTWTARETDRSWTVGGLLSRRPRLAAAVFDGQIYTSGDWAQRDDARKHATAIGLSHHRPRKTSSCGRQRALTSPWRSEAKALSDGRLDHRQPIRSIELQHMGGGLFVELSSSSGAAFLVDSHAVYLRGALQAMRSRDEESPAMRGFSFSPTPAARTAPAPQATPSRRHRSAPASRHAAKASRPNPPWVRWARRCA